MHGPSRYTTAGLQKRLIEEISSHRSVAVAVCEDGESNFAGSAPGFSWDTPVVVGCIAKCLTAALFAQSIDSLAFGVGDSISDALRPKSTRAASALAGIEVGHLLNHTHGFDDSDVDFDAVPRHADGAIHVDSLCSRLGDAPRIGEPGEIYSYGGAGSWLVAAFLEQRFGCTYLDLLRRDLFDPLGIQIDSDTDPHDVCPAWGGRLALSAVDLIRFLGLHLSERGRTRRGCLAVLRAGQIGMPGWVPWQQGATCGWNVYGNDWLGHNGNRQGTGIALRFHRSEPLAIAITSPKEADCFFALATLFGDVLEEYSADFVRFPRLLDSDTWDAKDQSRLLGDYENARWRVRIAESSRSGFLRMRVFDRRTLSSGSILDRHLRAAESDVFLAVPPGIDYPFAQFVGEEPATGHAKYFWNGRQLWRFAG